MTVQAARNIGPYTSRQIETISGIEKENDMNASKNATSKMSGMSAWLAGSALMVTTALAITFAVRSVPAKPAAEPPSHVQSVPNPAANERELDYLRALGVNIPLSAPDAAPPRYAQNVANAAANERELDYLRALGVNIPLAVQEAANQRELDYLRALGANIP